VDVRAGADSVVFTITATDDLSGVVNASMGFDSPSGAQHRSCGLILVSGTAFSGTHSCTVQWPPMMEAGVWKWSYLAIGDAVGNGHYHWLAEAVANGWPTEITVQSTPDVTAPVVTGVTVDRTAVDVRAGADSVVFTITATDDLSGVVNASMGFDSPSGAQHRYCGLILVSGTAFSGTYSCTVQWSPMMEAGVWKWSYLAIGDAVANGWPTEITVQSASPAPPIIPVGSALQAAPTSSPPAHRR
jgi:DUF971 family protein